MRTLAGQPESDRVAETRHTPSPWVSRALVHCAFLLLSDTTPGRRPTAVSADEETYLLGRCICACDSFGNRATNRHHFVCQLPAPSQRIQFQLVFELSRRLLLRIVGDWKVYR